MRCFSAAANSVHSPPQAQCIPTIRKRSAFPSPLWGGVRGGGRCVGQRPCITASPPSPTLPHKGGGSRPSLWREQTECAASAAVAQHEAGAARAADAAAQRFRGG